VRFFVIPVLSTANVEVRYHLCVLRDSIILILLTSKTEKRGRPRIRTAEYWREYYTRKQREWRAAHPRIKTGRNNETKSRHADEA
jgi:hypothetical protein